MAIRFRSRTNYAQILAGDKGGYNLGLDGAIFIRKEASPRVFMPPRVGGQGLSTSAAAPSTDIVAGANNAIMANVDGSGAITATIASKVGLDTGPEVAAALQTAINNAYAAAGRTGRVWVDFDGGLYKVYSQSTGLTSTVVISAAGANDLSADLKLGLVAGGTEVAGTDDSDFLLYTSGGPTYSQPVESNAHRSGRFHTGVIKKKKVVEWSVNTYVNMAGAAGDSVDTAVRLLWENLLGNEEVSDGAFIKYTQGLPGFYFSMARVSTIFGEYYTGCYVRENSIEFPGDGPATCAWSGKGAKRSIAGLASIPGALGGVTAVVVQNDAAGRYTDGARVMVIDPDGQTILAGGDGSLYVDGDPDTGTHTVTLSAAVTAGAGGFLAPWHPGAVQQSGRDNIFTDLEGSFKLRAAGATLDITNASLNIVNDHVDLDNRFGRDSNAGFVAGNRLTATLSVSFDLSNENFGEVVQTENFAGFDPMIVLGSATGRRLEITTKKWIPSVPTIEVPENGTTPVTLEGVLFQSAAGAQDPFAITFR